MIRPFRGVHPQIHETAFIADSAQIIGDVHVGEQASVWFGSVVRGDMFYIRIGDRTNVQDNCVIHTRTGEKPTILEEEVTVGHSVTLHGCYVERKSLIGIGSIVLDDVRVGAESLVAAGSLISPGTIIPPRSLVMGMPARVKRPLILRRLLQQERRVALRTRLEHGLVPVNDVRSSDTPNSRKTLLPRFDFFTTISPLQPGRGHETPVVSCLMYLHFG
jgi:carbonic anhydrase/acetyltransferase-like protein (isoleucine patch superfamily)